MLISLSDSTFKLIWLHRNQDAFSESSRVCGCTGRKDFRVQTVWKYQTLVSFSLFAGNIAHVWTRKQRVKVLSFFPLQLILFPLFLATGPLSCPCTLCFIAQDTWYKRPFWAVCHVAPALWPPCLLPLYRIHWSLRLTSFSSHLRFLEERAPTNSITISRWSARIYPEPWLSWDFLSVFNHFTVTGSETPFTVSGAEFLNLQHTQSSFCPQLNLMNECLPVMSFSFSACPKISLPVWLFLPGLEGFHLLKSWLLHSSHALAFHVSVEGKTLPQLCSCCGKLEWWEGKNV